MSTNAENLAKSKLHILKHWEEQVRKSLPGAKFESRPALRDHIPDFLDYLVEALKHGIGSVKPSIVSFAHHHGAERALLSAYTVEEALAEYNILRKVIFHELELNHPISSEDRDIIYEAINLGLSKAAAEYTEMQLRKIEKSEQKFRLLFNQAPVGIAEVEAKEKRFLRVNPRYCEMLGYSENELLKLTAQDITHPDDWEEDSEKLNKLLSEELKAYRREKRYIKKDGTVLWAEISVTSFRSDKGDAPFNIAVAIDITERRKILEALQKSEQDFRNLANALPQLVWIADATGNINWFNERWVEFSGRNMEELKQNGWESIHHPEYYKKGMLKFCEHMLSGETWEDTFPLQSKNGEWRWFLSRAIPVKNEKGEIRRWIGTNTDITEQKKILDALQEETVLRRKFVSTLTHDLRTPLTAAKMSADLIKRKSNDDILINLSVRISDNLMRANVMIEDLLDASKIRAGQALTPDIQNFNMNELLKKTIEDLTSIHGERFELQATEEVMVWLDPTGIRRVIENLCTNAIKYGSPHDNIRIKLDHGHKRLMLCVHNEGNPLMNIDKDKLFEPFQRGPDHNIAGKKGWGIGLTIVKGITEAHRGEVSVDSSEAGTTFKILLPIDARKTDETENQIFN